MKPMSPFLRRSLVSLLEEEKFDCVPGNHFGPELPEHHKTALIARGCVVAVPCRVCGGRHGSVTDLGRTAVAIGDIT